jgi:putative PIN family toxin of toxin-antitoxin system
MKILFDTNVYVSEALRGKSATAILEATERAGWRIYVSGYLLDELERVIAEKLGLSRRLAVLARQRAVRRSALADPGASRHLVPDDPNDSPILKCAMAAGVDYLITNDRHLLSLHPYEGLQIIPINVYEQLLREQGFIRD